MRILKIALCMALIGPPGCTADFVPTGDADEDDPGTDMESDLDVTPDTPDVEPDTEDVIGDATDVDAVDVGPECGNSETDDGEECDDGRNGDDDDGCTDACTFSCHDATDCLDDEVCNGDEFCGIETDDGRVCEDGTPREDGYVVADDPREICLDGATTASECGDDFVDTGAGEFCDPPGVDGCDDECHWGCDSAEDCPDDDDICNGEEFCNTTAHVCERRNVPDDGSVCGSDPRQICLSGNCQTSECGDSFFDDILEECDDGRDGDPDDGCTDLCEFSCHTVDDCDDAYPCNGLETCGAAVAGVGRVCEAGTIPTVVTRCDDGQFCTEDDFCDDTGACNGSGNPCDDELFCTDNVCTEASGCEYPIRTNHCLIDGTCYGDMAISTDNECMECDYSDDPYDWSPRTMGTSCDDEGLTCTNDECDAFGVCDHILTAGNCLIGGSCVSAGVDNGSNECQECIPGDDLFDWSPKASGDSCTDEGLDCTDDECDGFGTCDHILESDSCLIAGACVGYGTLDGDNECMECDPTDDQYDWSPVTSGTACNDDGLTCTVDECNAWGSCDHGALNSNTCLIADTCYDAWDPHPSMDCRECNPSFDLWDWSNASVGDACTDDGHACTSDQCNASGDCGHVIDSDWCLIGDACYSQNAENPSNDCQGCNPTDSQTSWWNRDSSYTCASDGVMCTDDVCNSMGACVHPTSAGNCRISGICYDDYDENTLNECQECNSTMSQSGWSPKMDYTGCTDDSLTCTDDVCLSGSCSHPIYDGECLISGTCYSDGFLNPANDCQQCDAWTNQTDWELRAPGSPCDDDVYCTIDETCNTVGMCSGTPETYLFGATHISSDADTTCVVLNDGSAKCWGSGGYGQLGNGSYGGSPYPRDVEDLDGPVTKVEAGTNVTCALLETGGVQCWGSNAYGGLGIDTVGDGNFARAQRQVSLPTSAVDICTGSYHACAALSSGQVWCWGYNSWGQLGRGYSGSGTETGTPVPVVSNASMTPITGVTNVDCTSSTSCATNGATGEVRCWGWGSYGNLGDDNGVSSSYPVWVVDSPGSSTHYVNAYGVDVGSGHVTSLMAGYPKAWGWNNHGQIGDDTASPWPGDYDAPVWVNSNPLPNSGNSMIDAGLWHTCSVRTWPGNSGGIMCWGTNDDGQLGDGGGAERNVGAPVLLTSGTVLSGASAVAAGEYHTCAIVGPADNVMCWGQRTVGQLGDGTYSGADVLNPTDTVCTSP